MTTWFLDMAAIWLTDDYTWPIMKDVNAYGVAGSRTLAVDTGTGTSYGNYASGKRWSLLTWNNQVVEILSVDGDSLIISEPLFCDTIKARYAFTDILPGDSFKAHRIAKIYPTGIIESFTSTIKATQEAAEIEPGNYNKKKNFPTCYFDMQVEVGRTMSLKGFIVSDRRRSSSQYRDALWNLIRMGWVHVMAGHLDDFTGNNTTPLDSPNALANYGPIGFIMEQCKISRDASRVVDSGYTPSSDYTRDRIAVTLKLQFAPNKGESSSSKELVEVQ